MNTNDLVNVIANLGGGTRVVTGTELREGFRASSIDIQTRPDGTESGGRITNAEKAELSQPSPRIVKWKQVGGVAVGFTLATAPGPFPGWSRI